MNTTSRLSITVLVVVAVAGLWAAVPPIGGPDVDDGFVIDRFDRQVTIDAAGRPR